MSASSSRLGGIINRSTCEAAMTPQQLADTVGVDRFYRVVMGEGSTTSETCGSCRGDRGVTYPAWEVRVGGSRGHIPGRMLLLCGYRLLGTVCGGHGFRLE